MASSLMHLAIAEKLTDEIQNPELFRLGCVLVDAGGQQSHYRALAADGRKFYDLERFRTEHRDRLPVDDFALGYYLHLVQDMLYRTFVYLEHGWNPRLPGNVERLYNDYRLLNTRLGGECGLQPLSLPGNLAGHPLLPDRAESFLADMLPQFEPYCEGEYFFLTPAMADEYIDRAATLCLRELRALRGEGVPVNPMDYAYGG